MGLRQPESLPEVRSLRLASIANATWQVLSHRRSITCTLAIGFTFGTLVGFLMSSQQIYQETFAVGDAFALYFGLGALAVGFASLGNAFWVERFGMRSIVVSALGFCVLWSLGFALWDAQRSLTLPGFMVFVVPLFFCLGLCFGNLNAMAMEPMGHIAGTASAVIGTLSSFVSVVFGGWAAGRYDGSLSGVLLGFSVGLALALLFVLMSGRVLDPVLAKSGQTH